MDTRATRTRLSVLPVFIALLFNLVLASPLAPVAPDAAVALTGSSFDATDGNLAVDGAETDWCSPGLNVTGTPDPERNTGDDSFKSSAENDAVPQIDVDSISNSTDYQQIYVASEAINNQLYAYVSFIRWDTNGTGTFSFELNQSGLLTSNGVTYQRTQDDVLLEFNFQKSADNWVVTLTYRLWNGNATSGSWSNAIAMGGFAEGSVNAGTIQNCLDGNASLVSGAFGEFAVNLSGLLGDDCAAFGTILAKSRASNTVTSALDDLAGPIPVDFNTCGELTILKQDENQQALGGASFSISPNPFGDDTPDPLIVTDGVAPDDDATGGTIHLAGVEPGTYKVCETAAPAGYIIDTACDIEIIGPLGSATFGPFTNGLGDISWTKIDSQTDQPLCCATFSLVGTVGAAIGTNLTVVDNGANDSDPAGGALLVTGLKLGTYVITETTPPAGYDADPDPQTVVLSGETASAEVAFEDAPQADASILKEADVNPIVAGEDASFTITVHAGGTGDSEKVVLTDVNETGHDWTVTGADSAACGLDLVIEDGDTLTCDFGTVPNGDDRIITITMASDEADCAEDIANTASVASSNDHDLTNNEWSDSITVVCPNPGVSKEATFDTIVFGEDAVFTIDVNAGGSGDAENVVLTDLNETGHTWTVTGTDSGACGADLTIEDGDMLTCTWVSIPNGATRSITITLTSGEVDCDLDLSNTASITADADVDESNNEDTASVHVLCPDASVLKSADATPITAGDPASFTIVVSANDTAASENVVLTDVNETGHDWTVSGADASACGADLVIEAGDTLTCNFGTISAEDSRTITIAMDSDVDDCAEGIANTATITSDADVDASDNESSDTLEVLCPDLDLVKTADNETVSAGEDLGFEITISNSDADGTGTATNATINDPLPGSLALGVDWSIDAVLFNGLALEEQTVCWIEGDPATETLKCEFGDLAPGDGYVVQLSSETSTLDGCQTGDLFNEATAEAENHAAITADATITVECPGLNFVKRADATPIVAGDEASFTLTVWNVGPGDVLDAILHDDLPAGLAWDFEIVSGDASDEDCMVASSVVLGGEPQMSIDCEFGTLGITTMEDGIVIRVFADTDQTDCGLLENASWVDGSNADRIDSGDSILVRCPTLVIDKVADTDVITITGPNDALVATPSVVTWTLTYTLTDGPVTNAVITDEVPVGFEFLDAANGGTLVDGVVTWTFDELTESGSVTFRTTVDPETISRVAPTVNTAVIVSDQTPEDEGQDGVTVTREEEQGGNPTPRPPLPNTAIGTGLNGEPITVPIELLVAFFIGSLGALALANVKARNNRR